MHSIEIKGRILIIFCSITSKIDILIKKYYIKLNNI
ncbi:unknown [[Mannheimia] succiniciproducens MBEL55E]|uniref:Uncharacterized protein n=1 Tax=Mannheimia succiniciproducens (strain KCTC 0769BP / MBEL55E) TaxID=221988 RepID=Q65UI7_MANSM|nr:unknown [[Mannheimia] succiniciproducens MBEL55E]